MKKLPLVFSGCLLGLAGAGNLIADTWPVLSHLLSLIGLVLWLFFLILHLFNWEETKQELTKPPLLSGMATFPMAGMILSTYVFRVFPALSLLAQGIWWFSFLLDLALIATFTIKFACPGRRVNATPSWTVLYVGIAVAALTYPLVGIIEIAYATLSFGFVLTFYLYPLIYSDLKKDPLPVALLGQEGIYLALDCHDFGISVLLFLCFDSPAQYFKTRISTSFLSPHLSNHYHSYFAQDGSGDLETSISGLSGVC